MSHETSPLTGFDEMNLSPVVLNQLQIVGYRTPTPIQSVTIPHLIQGKDMIGQARTGTGKTAAFALPLLSRIDINNKRPQILVLTPTRELAIQVAQSFKTYGSGMKGLNVLSIYGGQSYGTQLNQLKRGVHVIVGTPGRLMDHMRKKTVSLSDLFCIILDEADEMLHMGFIDDVEWILEKTPKNTQTALFSATMPQPIRKIAQKYLNNPKEINVKSDKTELATINQHYWMIKGVKKIIALIQILESVTFDGVIIFVKTKAATLDVAKALENKGFKAEALNGDLAQSAREKTVNRLKNGHIDLLVATDVAARGLDVNRISHVINYDMPPKTEPYIHRIGRTGRAGRTGEAILFLGRNERWMLRNIERTTQQKVKEFHLPSIKDINKKRVSNFNDSITQTLESEDLTFFQNLIETYAQENDIPVEQVAAACAKLNHGNTPFLLPENQKRARKNLKSEGVNHKKSEHKRSEHKRSESKRSERQKPEHRQSVHKQSEHKQFERKNFDIKKTSSKDPQFKKSQFKTRDLKNNQPQKSNIIPLAEGMERYRIEVGRCHGVSPRNIVGAIANESGLESKFIGNININQDFSLVDLPYGMPDQIFKVLEKTRVFSRQMAISKCA